MKQQALMVRWLTEEGIGTFQLLILRGSCQVRDDVIRVQCLSIQNNTNKQQHILIYQKQYSQYIDMLHIRKGE